MEVRQLDVPDTDVIQVGEGPDLLLLHTLLAERTVFDRALPDLAARHRLTIPNLPGYGTTPPLDKPDPEVRDYADRIAGIMDDAGLPDDIAVLGNGAGGFMSVSLAIHHGDRFGKLILADTGPGFPEPAKKPLHILADKVESEGMEAVLDAAMLRMFPEPYIAANPDIITERKAALATCQPAAFAATARALAKVEMADEIGGISNETMVMIGLDDQTTPPALSYALHEGIPGATLVEIEDCGHCPQIQQRDIFVKEVLGFLAA
ncbi:MAG: alpha/beta fold hydrolase [Alphaproteobacteria bacterium]|nr:alpha/beta fold hydrolase [Alphaproteobacteria bacterium]